MRQGNRKSAPKVKGGKVQRKNRSARTPNYWNTKQPYPVIDKEKPGEGYRHILKKRDIEKFIDILPDWEELSVGLDAILLAEGEKHGLGWHVPTIVAVRAWPRELTVHFVQDVVDEDKEILDALGVPHKKDGDGWWKCEFTEQTVRGYQLLAVLVHELGHHHDRMTTKSQKRVARGEPYAIEYTKRYAMNILNLYFQVFGY